MRAQKRFSGSVESRTSLARSQKSQSRQEHGLYLLEPLDTGKCGDSIPRTERMMATPKTQMRPPNTVATAILNMHRSVATLLDGCLENGKEKAFCNLLEYVVVQPTSFTLSFKRAHCPFAIIIRSNCVTPAKNEPREIVGVNTILCNQSITAHAALTIVINIVYTFRQGELAC